MDMKASAGRSGSKAGKSFFEWCESLSLKATRPGEPQLFAAIVSVFMYGGSIEICREGKEPLKVTYGDTGQPESETPA